MNATHLYDSNFPDEHKVKDSDIVSLYHEGRFEELDTVVICKDKQGNATATFGQSVWNCLPFCRKNTKNTLNFDEFETYPNLQRELKLIAYGWLFNKSPKNKKALVFSATRSRLEAIKKVYRFLASKQLVSMKALSSSHTLTSFESYLQEQSYTKNTISQTFTAINGAVHYASWHKLDLGIKPIQTSHKSRQLSDGERQQTLVIPERTCNAIYGNAIELIETALPHAQLIADTEKALQDNYLEAKNILTKRMKQGHHNYSFMNIDGSINNHKYSTAITDYLPKKHKDIISPLALKLPIVSLKNGNEFRRYLEQLITASYIVCGGFSGMRDSELQKLTPNSYYKDIFEGREYHMLQSHTFKLGEKRDTWVTAASAKTAIELMTVLTKYWRHKVKYPDPRYTDSIWVNQRLRSEPPKLITSWNKRLQNFCIQFSLTVSEDDYQECLESNPQSIEKIKKTVVVGKPWYLTTHQFRRTLAFYCIKNRLGSLVALKQQFKHLYLSMTEWYSNGGRLASQRDLKVDETIRQTLNEINAETTANKIFKQWHSDENLSGVHGKAIMKMRGDIPTIYSSWDIIYKAVKDGKLTLHGTAHSYCKSGYDCDMDGVVAPQFCVDCGSGSSVIDEQQAQWWQKKHCSITTYIASGENMSVSERSHYITQVRAAEIVMRDFGMEFTPFEAELAITEI